MLKRCFVFCVLLTVSSEVLFAQWKVMNGPPAPCGQGGRITEMADRRSRFTVYLTDCFMNQIGHTPFTTVFGVTVPVAIPGRFMGIAVGDAHNITQVIGRKKLGNAPSLPDNGGEIADLQVESLTSYQGQVQFESVFGRINGTVGAFVHVPIPDLYADTNGNGMLDAGDYLYSLVDVHQYLAAVPSFSLGDVFNIQNGEVAALPGMLFSSTPFVFDPSAPMDFDFTPYTGEGDVLSMHDPMATPEPATLVMAVSGVLAFVTKSKLKKISA